MTLERLFSEMGSHMDFEPALPLITFSAHLALEWLLTGVYHHMCFKMAFSYELFVAPLPITIKGSISKMGPHMNFKVACLLMMLKTV